MSDDDRRGADASADQHRPAVAMTDEGGGWRPTDVQALVLDAAFAEPEVAARAFARWEAITGFDEIDEGSYRLLPLVATRLHDLDITPAKPAVLQGVLRRSWFEVQMTLAETLPAVDTLQQTGVDTLLFKGAALGTLAYHTPGARPMRDLDVLVPESQAADALDAMLGTGWEPGEVPLPYPRGSLPPGFLRFRHSADLHGRNGSEVDLHWHATEAWCWPKADTVLWESSRPLEIGGRHVRALCAEDELLVACVHGIRWNPVPPLRWAADAMTIMRSGPIDWSLVVGHARQLRVEPLVLEPLRYLHERYDEVPATTLDALGARRPGWAERRWMATLVAPPGTRSFSAQYGRYLRSARGEALFGRYVGGLPEHLVHLLGRDSVGELPGEVSRRLIRRARRTVAHLAERA